MAGFKILHVDDDRRTLMMFKIFFESEGGNVFCADRGCDAIRVFKDSDFDIVITDLNMPEMDGFEVAKNIRLMSQGVPILMLTASSILPYNPEDYGISQVFIKPFNLKQILSAVGQEIEKSKMKILPSA